MPTMNRWARPLKVISVVLVVLTLLLVGRSLPLEQGMNRLESAVEAAGVWGPALFALAYAAATVLFIPGSALTLAAGAIFGLGVGTLSVSAGSTAGAALAFLIAGRLARDRVATRIQRNARFHAIDRAIGEQGWKIVALLRLSPAVPFNLQNYLYGLTSIGFWPCILASWVAMLPGTFLYVYLGHAARTGAEALARGGASADTARWVMSAVGLAATAAVTLYVTRLAGKAVGRLTQADLPNSSRKERGQTHPQPRPASRLAPVWPLDEHNRRWLTHVHPPDWENPEPQGRYNLLVVGAGPAGLVAAAGAAGVGAKVALVEKQLMGGDCLNVGCVPSKALLRSARAFAEVRDAGRFGVDPAGPARVDFARVMERLRRLRAGLSQHDSAARFRELGIDVFLGEGRFSGPQTFEIDGKTLRFAKACLATGARAAELPIPGLVETEALTNETVFTLTELPRRLAVIGAGPIGCELAQAFARFGSQVTLLEAMRQILPREDRDAAEIVEQALRRDGVQINCCSKVVGVKMEGDEKVLTLENEEDPRYRGELRVDQILVGVGRAPNVENLGLEAAGVRYGKNGIQVSDRLQTTNPRIYAAGDVCSSYRFTHAADALARIVIRNALFFGRGKASALTIPWCTYTDPEIAHVGMYEEEARARGIAVQTLRVELKDVDRAVLDGEESGFLKIHFKEGDDQILGATLVARQAGDMIAQIAQAMTARLGLKTLAQTIFPYPTQAEVIKKAADAYNRTRLTPTVRRLFEVLLSLSRS